VCVCWAEYQMSKRRLSSSAPAVPPSLVVTWKDGGKEIQNLILSIQILRLRAEEKELKVSVSVDNEGRGRRVF